MHELPQNGEVSSHAHQTETEIFICVEGEGILTIDEEEFPFKSHDIAHIPPLTKHRIQAISSTPLKFYVIVSPTGLEERLMLMGKLKKSQQELPPEELNSEISKKNTHGVIR